MTPKVSQILGLGLPGPLPKQDPLQLLGNVLSVGYCGLSKLGDLRLLDRPSRASFYNRPKAVKRERPRKRKFILLGPSSTVQEHLYFCPS